MGQTNLLQYALQISKRTETFYSKLEKIEKIEYFYVIFFVL